MKKFLIAIMLTFVLKAEVGKFGVEEDESVVVLTDDNFD